MIRKQAPLRGLRELFPLASSPNPPSTVRSSCTARILRTPRHGSPQPSGAASTSIRRSLPSSKAPSLAAGAGQRRGGPGALAQRRVLPESVHLARQGSCTTHPPPGDTGHAPCPIKGTPAESRLVWAEGGRRRLGLPGAGRTLTCSSRTNAMAGGGVNGAWEVDAAAVWKMRRPTTCARPESRRLRARSDSRAPRTRATAPGSRRDPRGLYRSLCTTPRAAWGVGCVPVRRACTRSSRAHDAGLACTRGRLARCLLSLYECRACGREVHALGGTFLGVVRALKQRWVKGG